MKILKPTFQKRKVLGMFLFLLFFSLFIPPVRAKFVEDAGVGGGEESTWQKFSESVNRDEVDIWSWSGYAPLALVAHINSWFSGYPDENGNISFTSVEKSLFGGVSKLISYTYQKPISSQEYLAYFSQKLNLATPAFAQGQGWNFLAPVLELWKITRNIAYLFFVIIFVAIGFTIMFRSKVDPQTVASIQSSIPKIVVSLILITFSYAIIGLIIDLVFLLNKLIDQTFFLDPTSPTGHTPIGDVIFNILSAKPFSFPLGTVSVDVVMDLFWQTTNLLNLTAALGGPLNIVLAFFLSVVIFSTAFRLFLSLLGRYVNLILSTLISPFVFLWGTLPGQGEVGSLFRTIFSSAIAFPAVYLILNIALYFSGIPSANFQGLTPFDLNILQTTTFASGTAPTLNAAKLIALGIFLFTPKIPEIIDGLLKAEKAGVVGGVMGPELTAGLRRIPVIGGLLS